MEGLAVARLGPSIIVRDPSSGPRLLVARSPLGRRRAVIMRETRGGLQEDFKKNSRNCSPHAARHGTVASRGPALPRRRCLGVRIRAPHASAAAPRPTTCVAGSVRGGNRRGASPNHAEAAEPPAEGSRWWELNPQPRLYESRALPLSYIGAAGRRGHTPISLGTLRAGIKGPAGQRCGGQHIIGSGTGGDGIRTHEKRICNPLP